MPSKFNNLGSFTIPCIIGFIFFTKCLCDLRSSINSIPLSIFKDLGLTGITPTSLTLQLADCSVKRPVGIIEDVLVEE